MTDRDFAAEIASTGEQLAYATPFHQRSLALREVAYRLASLVAGDKARDTYEEACKKVDCQSDPDRKLALCSIIEELRSKRGLAADMRMTSYLWSKAGKYVAEVMDGGVR